MYGFLYSQIGYDTRDVKRALLRGRTPADFSDNPTFCVRMHRNHKVFYEGAAVYWGQRWDEHWWILDFTDLQQAGEYRVELWNRNELIDKSDRIVIQSDVLWKCTVPQTVFHQLDARAERARNAKGWKDSGSAWRELCSHATTLIGLSDFYESGLTWLDREENDALLNHFMVGCDYMALCYQKANQSGFPLGAVIHELPNHHVVIPGEVAQFAVAMARVSRIISDRDVAKSIEYLEMSEKAVAYCLSGLMPYSMQGFSHTNHGAPGTFSVSDEFMTRDLLMMLWACIEIVRCGKQQFKDACFRLCDDILARQIPKARAENGFYGHFYTFKSAEFSEKANIHHHVGHDTGGVFPFYVLPILMMAEVFYDDERVEMWKQCVRDFAYGFFLPACESNPFNIIPVGFFADEGLLEFCGPWHGINVSYGFASTLAIHLAKLTGDNRFCRIAEANLQWIAGLNCGITEESMESCTLWNDEVETGHALPLSMIHGIGSRHVQVWSGIDGAIANGFSANRQFQFDKPSNKSNDKPSCFGDEDWLPHTAGWISALALQREHKHYTKGNLY